MGEKATIGLDSNAFIYLFEKNPEHLEAATRLFNQIESGEASAVTSTLTLTEVMVKPLREGNPAAAYDYALTIENFPHLTVAPLCSNSARKAAELRALYGVTVPDAVHVATAITGGASIFVSNDRSLKRIKEIKVESLSEAVK